MDYVCFDSRYSPSCHRCNYWASWIRGGFCWKTPWQMTALPFIVSLMGWMPAPIEISAINFSLDCWKRKNSWHLIKDGLFDFNVGFIGTAILAVFFVALGALIQYPTGQEVQATERTIQQFVGMYASVLGDWSRFLITFIAFLCIFGTVITVIDGYSRVNAESLRLLSRKEITKRAECLDDCYFYHRWYHHLFFKEVSHLC